MNLKISDANMMRDAAQTIDYLEREFREERRKREEICERISTLLFGPAEGLHPVKMDLQFSSFPLELRKRAEELDKKASE